MHEAAADFAAFDDRGFRNTLLAAVAAFFDVCSLRRAIWITPLKVDLLGKMSQCRGLDPILSLPRGVF